METEQSLGETTVDNLYYTSQVQGLDTPLSLSEKVFQKIWLKKDFLHDNLQTICGKSISINDTGRWNLLEGPDFKAATLEIDGKTVTGDIEIHFEEQDWFQHTHDQDPNFNNVILHVLLFPPKDLTPPSLTAQGYCPKILVLLDYLHQGIEEYALEDALLTLSKQDSLEVFQIFLQKNAHDRKLILFNKAQDRWRNKVTFAQRRLDSQGIEATCHQMALEVLGYKRNRAPMSALACQYPITELNNSDFSIQTLFESQKDNWRLNGIRPANHPLKRIEQYQSLIKANPEWISDWEDFSKGLKKLNLKPTLNTTEFRKELKLTELKTVIKETILMNCISGTRLDTLIIDALLPIAAAHHKINLFPLWFHWFGGDAPELVNDFLHHCDILSRKDQPLCNGLNQGALQIFFEHKL